MNEASALAVNCHTSLCVLSHPKGERKKERICHTARLYGEENDDWNSAVFRSRRNRSSDGAERTDGGRAFHARVAATGKARPPSVVRRVDGMIREKLSRESCTDTLHSRSDKHIGGSRLSDRRSSICQKVISDNCLVTS